jgi:hypothetical protein
MNDTPKPDVLVVDGDFDRDHPAPPTAWRCRRCAADVIEGRCQCLSCPSPWEPVPAN